MVEAAFRPAEENPRSLLDFVDEQSVETMRDAVKESIRESRVGIVQSVGSSYLMMYAGNSNLLRLFNSFF